MKKNMGSFAQTAELESKVNQTRVSINQSINTFKGFNQKTITEKVRAVKEVYQKLDEADWKNRKQG
jgi:hypothetical protein